MNRYKLEYECVRRATKWWSKVLGMSDERLAKGCYKMLLQLNELESNEIMYNWGTQIKHILEKLDYKHVFENQCVETVEQYFDEIVLKLKEKIRNEDLIAVSNSKYSCIFKSIISSNDYLYKDIISSK